MMAIVECAYIYYELFIKSEYSLLLILYIYIFDKVVFILISFKKFDKQLIVFRYQDKLEFRKINTNINTENKNKFPQID